MGCSPRDHPAPGSRRQRAAVSAAGPEPGATGSPAVTGSPSFGRMAPAHPENVHCHAQAHSHGNGGINRRQFLGSAGIVAAGAAAPLVLPAGCSAQTPRASALRSGSLARGARLAREHSRVHGPGRRAGRGGLRRGQLANGRGQATVEASYAKKAPGGTYKGAAAYRDFRELLARADIDAVMISTPDHWHVPMALAAVQGRQGRVAGKTDHALHQRGPHPGRLVARNTSASSASTASFARSNRCTAPPNWCATAASARLHASAPASPVEESSRTRPKPSRPRRRNSITTCGSGPRRRSITSRNASTPRAI